MQSALLSSSLAILYPFIISPTIWLQNLMEQWDQAEISQQMHLGAIWGKKYTLHHINFVWVYHTTIMTPPGGWLQPWQGVLEAGGKYSPYRCRKTLDLICQTTLYHLIQQANSKAVINSSQDKQLKLQYWHAGYNTESRQHW